tara:strand:- start:5088 stop:9638 length:4551 start_codon:yes stop_codon:yes gene_type:complete
MLFQNSKYIIIILLIGSLLFPEKNNRDCPDNFILNPQFPINGPECFPEQFLFSSSSKQAFYYFNLVTIDENPLEPEDWVGAFNGDICIGSKQWDVNQCNGNICDIPIMGNDESEYSQGYIESGEIPTFKIYDFSNNSYYDAVPSYEEPWYDLNLVFIDFLNGSTSILGCTDDTACNYNIEADTDDGSCWFSTDGCSCDFPEGSVIDECGICNGFGILDGFCDCDGNILDECNQCSGPGAVYECGCNDISDGFCDCDGNILDECGICDGPGLNINGCCGLESPDCFGNCGGFAVEDQCGVCDFDITNDCIQDCLGIWGGSALYDQCGVCDSDITNDCEQDCNGIWGGDSIFDDCNVCNGDNSSCNAPTSFSQIIETEEDSSVTFNINAIDPNNDNLQLIILSNPNHGYLDIIDGINVTYIPNENYSGQDNIIYKVSDGVWDSNSSQITINITESYDPPIISDIYIDALEDEPIIINLGAYDTDSNDDELLFNIIVYPDFGLLESQRAIGSYLYTPNINYYGPDSFIYEVTDGINSSQAEVFINVININDAPQCLDFNFTDLEIIDFEDFIDDFDQDNLQIKTIPPSLNNNLVTIYNNEFIYSGLDYIYTYETNNNEFDILLYKVTDGISESNVSTAIFDNTNEGFNRQIPIALSDEVVMEEDNQIQISFFTFDYDGFLNGSPIIEITGFPLYGVLGEISEPVISGVVAEWTASYTPSQYYFGNDQILFSVVDDDNESSAEDGIISLIINPVNNYPILDNLENINFDEDTSFTLNLFATDIDGDNLVYSVSEGVNISANLIDNSIEFSPLFNWNGLETFTITVSDGILQDSQVINVEVNSVNDFPTLISNLNDINFNEDESILVNLFASDIDNDNLYFSISEGENILAVLNTNPISVEFSSIANWNGSETFSISVSDGSLVNSYETIVTVNPINDPPLILSLSQVEVEANAGYSYFINAIDVDSDELIYDISGFPDGMVINDNVITWETIPSNISNEEFLISVSDDSFTIYENVNLTIIQFYDCNGEINGNAIEDCNGICEGLSMLDDCGVCDTDYLNDNQTCTGCTNMNACNYDPVAIFDNDTCEFPTVPYNCSNECINDSDLDGICNELEIYGCTDPISSNYNEFATEDDGTCINPDCNQEFILDSFDYHEFEFNGSVTAQIFINGQENGSINDVLIGFVDEEIRGYAYGAIFPINGLIQFPIMLYSNQVSGEIINFKYYHASSNQTFCLSETLEFTNNMIIGNGLDPFIFNIQEEYILGCTDISACNYNIYATFNNGDCIYSDLYYDCNGNCLSDNDNDNICDELDICEGQSNIDSDGDGVCNDLDICIGFENVDIDQDGICDDYDDCFGSDNIDTDQDGICNDQEVEGCIDPEACNYDANATDSGDCFYDLDCAGICGGNSFFDVCGDCVSEGTNPGDCLDSEIHIPESLYLSQNYPNPFNPISKIHYGVPKNDFINITLYDLNGRVINNLVNSFHSAGYYTLILQSDGLNSGIYLVKILSSNQLQTRKITIIK